MVFTVISRAQAGPLLEGARERARFLKTDQFRHLVHRQLLIHQLVDRYLPANIVLDFLITGAFLQQPSVEGE